MMKVCFFALALVFSQVFAFTVNTSLFALPGPRVKARGQEEFCLTTGKYSCRLS
jgi:hypothetical protein